MPLRQQDLIQVKKYTSDFVKKHYEELQVKLRQLHFFYIYNF